MHQDRTEEAKSSDKRSRIRIRRGDEGRLPVKNSVFFAAVGDFGQDKTSEILFGKGFDRHDRLLRLKPADSSQVPENWDGSIKVSANKTG